MRYNGPGFSLFEWQYKGSSVNCIIITWNITPSFQCHDMLVQTQPSLIHWFMKAQSRDLTKWLCAKRVLREDNQGLLCSILQNSSLSAFPKNQCHGIVCGVILHEHAVKLEKRFVSSQFSLSSPSTWRTSRKIFGRVTKRESYGFRESYEISAMIIAYLIYEISVGWNIPHQPYQESWFFRPEIYFWMTFLLFTDCLKVEMPKSNLVPALRPKKPAPQSHDDKNTGTRHEEL